MEKLTIRLPKAAGAVTLDVPVSSLPESIRWELMRHGLQQKVADSCARTKEQPALTEAEAMKECMDVVASLQSGTWAQRSRTYDFDGWFLKQAAAEAAKRVKPGGKNAGADVEKVKAALVAHETYRGLMKAKWDEMQAAKVSVDLEIEV